MPGPSDLANTEKHRVYLYSASQKQNLKLREVERLRSGHMAIVKHPEVSPSSITLVSATKGWALPALLSLGATC